MYRTSNERWHVVKWVRPTTSHVCINISFFRQRRWRCGMRRMSRNFFYKTWNVPRICKTSFYCYAGNDAAWRKIANVFVIVCKDFCFSSSICMLFRLFLIFFRFDWGSKSTTSILSLKLQANVLRHWNVVIYLEHLRPQKHTTLCICIK